MSYVHLDDRHDGGRLTMFRERLAGEVSMRTGEELTILQDRNDPLWSQQWKDRVEDSIDDTTFLIAIVTPRFFHNSDCRIELQRFFDREQELKRNDLVMPVYYVTCPLLEDQEKLADDDLARRIVTHSYTDWRELRFEPFTSLEVGRTLERMAIQIGDALKLSEEASRLKRNPISRALGLQRHHRPRQMTVMPSEPDSEGETDPLEEASAPPVDTGPPTRVVDPFGRADHITISEAIEKANPGDRILVRPGLYQDGLHINKPLEIIGDGDLEDIVVQTAGQNALLFDTTMARVVNLTFRQLEGRESFCVNIARGRLFLEDCDITSKSLACVAIWGGADPRLHRNRIHDGRQGGVIVYENGLGTLEDNEIFRNALSGVEIKTDGNPVLRHNRIYENKESGVYIYENGQGLLEDNDIFNNSRAGVRLGNSGSPILRRNRINRNGIVAVWSPLKGGGDIEDNDLRQNAYGAWNLSTESEQELKRSDNLE